MSEFLELRSAVRRKARNLSANCERALRKAIRPALSIGRLSPVVFGPSTIVAKHNLTEAQLAGSMGQFKASYAAAELALERYRTPRPV